MKIIYVFDFLAHEYEIYALIRFMKNPWKKKKKNNKVY